MRRKFNLYNKKKKNDSLILCWYGNIGSKELLKKKKRAIFRVKICTKSKT